MLIPYATDAPLYHRPIATVGLIATNIAVFVLQLMAPDLNEQFVLVHGEFNPLQWVTSVFMHADVTHLIGNMIFLWIFGLVIEGKVGWKATLAIFILVGATQCAIEQSVALFFPSEVALPDWLGGDPASLGASAAIYGMMVIAVLWAPENEVHFFFIFWYRIVSSFEVPLLMVGFFYVSLDFLAVWALGWYEGLTWSSGLFHLMGGAIGGLVGYAMLKYHLVDCEGFDMLSIWQGKRGQKELTPKEKEQEREAERQLELDKARQVADGMHMVEQYLKNGHVEMAINRFQIVRRKDPTVQLPEHLHVSIINSLLQDAQLQEKAIPFMESYIARYSKRKTAIQLNLARLYLDLKQRPRRALVLAHQVDLHSLTERQREFLQAIIVDARKMIDDGVVEPRDA